MLADVVWDVGKIGKVAPVAVLWTRLIAGAPAGPGRPLRMGTFLAGYLLVWAVAGTVAFAALASVVAQWTPVVWLLDLAALVALGGQ